MSARRVGPVAGVARRDFGSRRELQMRRVATRGEVRVVVSFGPTSSPVLSRAASCAIEQAWRTEELRSGVWEATFPAGGAERVSGEIRHLVRMVHGWKTTRLEVDGSVDQRRRVLAMLHCARERLINRGDCGAWFLGAGGAQVLPLSFI